MHLSPTSKLGYLSFKAYFIFMIYNNYMYIYWCPNDSMCTTFFSNSKQIGEITKIFKFFSHLVNISKLIDMILFV